MTQLGLTPGFAVGMSDVVNICQSTLKWVSGFDFDSIINIRG